MKRCVGRIAFLIHLSLMTLGKIPHASASRRCAPLPTDRRHRAQKPSHATGRCLSCFGLHPVPEQSAPNYDRLARLDDLGLIWLLRGRPIVELTSTEAVICCPSGATLKFYRRTKPAQAGIGYLTQIVKPAPQIADDAAEIAKGATA